MGELAIMKKFCKLLFCISVELADLLSKLAYICTILLPIRYSNRSVKIERKKLKKLYLPSPIHLNTNLQDNEISKNAFSYIEDYWTNIQLNNHKVLSGNYNKNHLLDIQTISGDKNHDRSFSASERIPNLIRLYNLADSSDIKLTIAGSILNSYNFIIDNLEVYPFGFKDFAKQNTNNHYLSNLRTIILCHLMTNKLQTALLFLNKYNQAYNLLHQDSRFIEGSNYYKSIVDSYNFEIYIAFLNKEIYLPSLMKPVIRQLKIENLTEQIFKKQIFFGSISPDPSFDRYNLLERLFKKPRSVRKHIIYDLADRIIIEYKNWKLLIPKNQFSVARYHINNSYGNFTMFFKDKCIIDSHKTGRYDWNNQKIDGRSACFHNSISVGKNELWPLRKRILYPFTSRKIIFDYKIEFKEDEVIVSTFYLNFFGNILFTRKFSISNSLAIETEACIDGETKFYINLNHDVKLNDKKEATVGLLNDSIEFRSDTEYETILSRQYINHRDSLEAKTLIFSTKSFIIKFSVKDF